MKQAKLSRRVLRWPIRAYAWAAERLYDELAWAYDAVSWMVSLGKWSSWRSLALRYVRGTDVLELGPGTGELLIEMHQRGLRAAGLEPSVSMQRVAARKLRRRGIGICMVRGTAQRMPFAGASFDTIVATFPAGYILDVGTMIEIARLLRRADPRRGVPGGRLVIVGVVVSIRPPLSARRSRQAFGGTSDRVISHLLELSAAAGMRVDVIRHSGNWVTVPILVGERLAELKEQERRDSRA